MSIYLSYHQLDEIVKKPNITRQELSEKLNISQPTVSRIIKKLKDNDIIERVGSDTKGEWKILK